MLCFAFLLVLLVSYALYQGRFLFQRQKLKRRTWDDLLAAIQPVNTRGVSKIAIAYLKPTKEQLRLQPFEMWELIGKHKGIAALNANADAMLDLAMYAAQWDRVEGRIVGEMMRRDAVRLKRATRRIRLAIVHDRASKFAAFELQEAASAYYLMRERLCGLYQGTNSYLYPHVVAAVVGA